jgi:hypothetical protein
MPLQQFILSLISNGRVRETVSDMESFLRKYNSPLAQTLYPLLFQELKAAKHPAIPLILESAYKNALVREMTMEKAQQDLEALLKSARLNYLFYKGLSVLNRYYDMPGTRPMRDIDILVDKKDLDGLKTVLAENGFAFSWSTNYHFQFRKNSLVYEFHTALFSYKYRVMFRLQEIDHEEILKTASIGNELYLLLTTLQHFDEMGTRLIPFLDIYHIISKGINQESWRELVAGCEAAFPVLFCHHTMEGRFGYSPFTEELLDAIRKGGKRVIPAETEERIKKLALHALKKTDTYWTVFKMAENKMGKLFHLARPPEEIYAHYSAGSRLPWITHIFRSVRRLGN